MKRLFCDRCGNEMQVAYKRVWISLQFGTPVELCQNCADALDRFMGTDSAGYEKITSEVAEP